MTDFTSAQATNLKRRGSRDDISVKKHKGDLFDLDVDVINASVEQVGTSAAEKTQLKDFDRHKNKEAQSNDEIIFLRDPIHSRRIEILVDRWMPSPVAQSIPSSVLKPIFKELATKDAIACLETCHSWRHAMLDMIGLKPRMKEVKLASPSPDKVSQSNWKDPDMINSLPSEVLLDVFYFMNTVDLIHCQGTCQKWKQLIDRFPTLWIGKPHFFGSLEKIDRQWTKLKQLSQGRQVKSMTLDLFRGSYTMTHEEYITSMYKFDWHNTRICREFPHDTLETFSYYSDSDFSYHVIWNSVVKCTKLKTLRFPIYTGTFRVEGTPLENCRLEYFELGDTTEMLETDKGMYKLLSQVKTISLTSDVHHEDMYEILSASKDSLEDLYLNYYTQEDLDDGTMEALRKRKIVMKNLRSFEGYIARPPFELIAPNLKIFKLYANCLDGPDLMKCLSLESVETFQYYINDEDNLRCLELEPDKQPDRISMLLDLQWKLHQLKRCNTLAIELQQEGIDDKSTDAFWKAFFTSYRILPKLQNFTISDPCSSPCFSIGKSLIRFLKRRQEIGLPPLENLCLVNCTNFRGEDMAILRQMVPKFSIRWGEEWKYVRFYDVTCLEDAASQDSPALLL